MSQSTFDAEFMKKFQDAGAHLGYSKTRRHPSALPFIFGTKNRKDIINIEKTIEQLQHACEYIADCAKNGGMILFVGSKAEARNAVTSAGESLNMPYVNRRWIGGTLTNFDEIRGRVTLLEDLLDKQEKNELVYKTKKEKLLLDRKIEKLKRNFGGLTALTRKPKVMVIIDTKEEDNALEEAMRLGIPVVGIVNTDCNVKNIHYPIVANDARKEVIEMILSALTASAKNS